LFDDYLDSFEHADHVLITEIFPSREKYRDDISALQLVQAMEHSDAKFFPGKFQVVDYLVNYLEPGDVVLVLSAGDANQISSMVYERLSLNGNAK
jgi:UDP-N-acetylmuramate--alanine ligase